MVCPDGTEGVYGTCSNGAGDESGRNVFWWLIVIILILLIVAVVILLIVRSQRDINATDEDKRGKNSCGGDSQLNEPCGSNCQCAAGLECQNSVCKSGIGQACQSLSDCVSSATGCQNRVCVRDPQSQEQIITGVVGSQNPDNPILNQLMNQPAQINQACTDQPCAQGLICDSGICKVDDDEACTGDQDCKSNSKCVEPRVRYGRNSQGQGQAQGRGQGQNQARRGHKVCQPRYKVGGGDSRLLVMREGRPEPYHHFPGQELVDVVEHQGRMLMLLSDGNILRQGFKRSSYIEMVKSNVRMERLASIYNWEWYVLFGLSQGRLYELEESKSSDNDWYWRPVPWAPSDIRDLSYTSQGHHLWLQYALQHHISELPHQPSRYYQDKHRLESLNQMGCLYQFDSQGEKIQEVNHYMVAEHTTRVYGEDEVSYLELDHDDYSASRQPQNDSLDDFLTGALRPDGTTFSVSSREMNRIRAVRMIRNQVHIITQQRYNDSDYYELACLWR